MTKRFAAGLLGVILTLPAYAELSCRCLPGQPCWPGKNDWEQLAKSLKGNLVQPKPYLADCQLDVNSDACKKTLANLKNPFYIESNPANTQTQGWLGAWRNQPSAYAVEAENTSDVVAAVDFARSHNLRIVIKGTGHDYLGRSSAPDSLLIWTHKMDDVVYHESFVPYDCEGVKGVPAFTVDAGTNWLKVYTEATTKRSLYVQGGGCTTVGAAGGFPQGGGFGQYSRKYGTGAAGILQAQVVTADGKTLIANQCINKDLFWAIRGGGGGTYGVVTKLTLMAHELPKEFGLVMGKITAKDDKAYKKLIKEFLTFFDKNLVNEHWGEQFAFSDKNEIPISMLAQGFTQDKIKKIWKPMQDWVKKNKDYSMKLDVFMIPANKMWDPSFWKKHKPELVKDNTLPDAKPGEYWWAPDAGQVSWYIYNYESWWLPRKLFSKENIDKTTDTIFNASRLWKVAFHNNKALAGASKDAIERSKKTSTHPGVYNAATLIIMNGSDKQGFLGVQGKQPDMTKGKEVADKINQAMQMFMQLAPNGGAYVSEADYFQKNWQKDFWGNNYTKLYKIKMKYDPNGMFYCHHCVGSELWQEGGMCPVATVKPDPVPSA